MREALFLVSLEMWFGTFFLAIFACAVLSLLHAYGCGNEISDPNQAERFVADATHAGESLVNEQRKIEKRSIGTSKNNKRLRMRRRQDTFSKEKNWRASQNEESSMTSDANSKRISRAGQMASFERSASRADGEQTIEKKYLGQAVGNLHPLSLASLPRVQTGADFLADLRWKFKRANSNPWEIPGEISGKTERRRLRRLTQHRACQSNRFRSNNTVRTFSHQRSFDPSRKAIRRFNIRLNSRSYFPSNDYSKVLKSLKKFEKYKGETGEDGHHSIHKSSLMKRSLWQGEKVIGSNLFDLRKNIGYAESKLTIAKKNAIHDVQSNARASVSLNLGKRIHNGHYPNKKENSSLTHNSSSSSLERFTSQARRGTEIFNNKSVFVSRDGFMLSDGKASYSRDLNQHQDRQGSKRRQERSVKTSPIGSNRNIRARKEGDAIIGALFPLHQAPTQKTAYTRQCGLIREYYGIQRVEAFLMTLESINNDPSILPDMKLGWDIRDSCWYSAIALENSIDFIKDAIASQSANLQKSQATDHRGPGHDGIRPVTEDATGRYSLNSPRTDEGLTAPESPRAMAGPSASSRNQTGGGANGCVDTAHLKPIAGLVGPGSSEASIQVQNLLQIFNIPQIGYSATSIDLSDKSHYKYFLRVVPPDRYQAQALVDVVVNFNWTYISTVHSDGNYGIKGMEMFTDLAKSQGVCIATSDNVASTASDEQFDEVVNNLMETPNATVVVCFCEGLTVKNLFLALRRQKKEGHFMIVGSDGWGNRRDVVKGLESTAAGGISIKLNSPPFRNFSAHYSQLRPERSLENPWFHSFWQQKFNCSLDEHKVDLRGYGRFCSGKESLAGSDEDSKLGFVVNAVTTMAKALHNMREDLCPGSKGLCSAMSPINGSVYLSYLLNVSFWDYSGELVHFDDQGDPPGRYEILNYQRIASPDGNVTYRYVTIGHWMTGKLNLSEQQVQWPARIVEGNVVRRPVMSVCSEPCKKDQAKKVKGVACCWICDTCLENQYLIKNNTDCRSCELGFWPDENKTSCEIIPEEFIKWQDTQAIVCLALSCFGISWTIWVAVIFIRFHETPVVKASTRELSYIILVGIGLAFSANLFIVAKPNKEFCYLTRILPGLSFSLIYGALVTKTNRIARILEGSKRITTKKPRFMSASAQVVITGMIIGMECAVITGMLIYQPANSKLHYPEPRRARLVCDTSTLGIVVPLGFDLVLILLCTLYAVKTRNLPENFNEAKFIGFTMYATCVIWLGFFPIYFAGENKEVTLSVSISLSAAIALLLLFLPKVYVIIWVPERNTRGAFATSRDVRCHIGSKSMASGDSIDIKESSTYENLFKSDKTAVNPKQWKQKSLDEKRLRFVMQRVSDPEHASSYINHGVLGKKTHLGSCGVLAKISKDSTRTESSHISAMSTCSEKEKIMQSEASPSELAPPSRPTKIRPASPSEREKHRIHTASRDDQQLLENIKMSGAENCRVVPAYFRKSLSSTCVSSCPKTRTVQCQTSDDLVQSLYPALRRRRCVSSGKHKLVRSSAVDDANCEMDSAGQLCENSSIRRGRHKSDNSDVFKSSSDFSEGLPYVVRHGPNPWCVCRDTSVCRPSHNLDKTLTYNNSKRTSGHRRGSNELDLFHAEIPKSLNSPFTRSDFARHPRASLKEGISQRDFCPLHEEAEKADPLSNRFSSSEDEACCFCGNSDAPNSSSCHNIKKSPLRPSPHGAFPPSSFFKPIHGSCSHSISSASSSSTLPPFNTSTESTKSNHSCGAHSDTNEEFHTFISMDTDEEEDDELVNELSPLRLGSADSKGLICESANAPLQIFVQEENDMLEFQKYLKSHGVKLDLSSVQSSDL